MSEAKLMIGGGEQITVHVSAENYEKCVFLAAAAVSDKVDHHVHVAYADASDGDWYLAMSDCEVSPGGTKIGGTFTFSRRIDD